jgi:2-amino-4-hydroxy-6-hydroxymethyldihydropteridine diphosphokinase
MTVCLVGLGANLGDRARTLDAAVEQLRGCAEISRLAVSRWHEFAPVGGPGGQPAFLNGAVRLETSLSPAALLALFHAIEDKLGRTRDVRWDARTIDIDLLLYGEQTVQTADLTIPHPRMSFRRFVLAPAAEVAGEMVHPKIGWTVAKLLDHLNNARPYVAIAGYWLSGVESACSTNGSQLAARVAAAVDGQLIVDPSGPDRLPGPASSSLLAFETEIKSLWRRLSLLDFTKWQNAGRPWISDFWFDQSLVSTALWLPRVDYAIYEQQWREAFPKVAAPKLTAMVEYRIDDRRDCLAEYANEMADRLYADLNQRFDAPGHGPTLRLPANDPERAFQELVAAIEAMK